MIDPTHYYEFFYDDEGGEFLGFVNDDKGFTVFSIDDTEKMRELISAGEMKHIDDLFGLETYLKKQGVLSDNDSLKFKVS